MIYYAFILWAEEWTWGVLGKHLSQPLEKLYSCQLTIFHVNVRTKNVFVKFSELIFIERLLCLCNSLISCLKAAQPVLPMCLVKCQGPIILSFFIWVFEFTRPGPESLPASPRSGSKQPGLNTPLMLTRFSGCAEPLIDVQFRGAFKRPLWRPSGSHGYIGSPIWARY